MSNGLSSDWWYGPKHQAQRGCALPAWQGALYRRYSSCPGMLYMDIVRSPYAHATIKSIDASKALALARCARGNHRERP